MVVLSLAHYTRLQTKIELLTKLGVARSQLTAGERGRTSSSGDGQRSKKLGER